MNILFDGNYLIHKTFSIWSLYYQDRTKSAEENELLLAEAMRDKDKQQVFVRKIIMDFCATVKRFKSVDRVAFVIDSHSWRYRFHRDYKYSLTKIRGEYFKEFCNLIDLTEKYLRNKGFIVSRVNGAEGDDLLYIWSIYFSQVLEEDLVVITADSDIRQIINQKVSVFCNNSKNLRFFCHPSREVEWNEYFDTDVMVESVNAFEIVLYKVIMGDKSDNIAKVKTGFGDVAFRKFIDSIKPYDITDAELSVVDMAQWIAGKFCNFSRTSKYEDILGKVLFNLKMTWLNLAVYNSQNFLFENGKSLLENMLDDVNKNKNSYKYCKEFSLEHVYGSIIK